MSATLTHQPIVKVKSAKFDVDALQTYALCLNVGIRDVQVAVVDETDNSLVLLEDYRLEGVKTVNARIDALRGLYQDHAVLKAGFWSKVKLAVKTHKFALVPTNLFAREAMMDYLSISSEVKKTEVLDFYKQISSDHVTVFANDSKLDAWFKETYPTQNVQVLHQGSALIEGVMKYDDHSHEKSMFCNLDGNILHILVSEKRKLLYYNQFAVKESQDFLRFIMLVFKEVGLNQKTSKVIFWGAMKHNSPHIELLKKYIRNISFGARPGYLRYSFEFDELPEHQYFDSTNIYLCE